MSTEKKPLVILTGPTASGKTALSLCLAKRIGGEIISADSMQVYRRMDIGTAKITKDEMGDIPHHLIDVLEPFEEFNVFLFRQMAMEAIEGIYERGKIPILAGGTGFYLQAVIRDVDFSETGERPDLREYYSGIAEKEGTEALHRLLADVDPEAAEQIHPNNVKRVIRALEYFAETGGKISGHNEVQRQKESPFDYRYFVLTDKRQTLYERINLRVDQMMEAGLEEEVRSLAAEGLTAENISMKGIGYREFFPYFAGECTLEETVEKIRQDTRHFAKRQLTWFRREKDVIWLDREKHTEEELLEMMLEACASLPGISIPPDK